LNFSDEYASDFSSNFCLIHHIGLRLIPLCNRPCIGLWTITVFISTPNESLMFYWWLFLLRILEADPLSLSHLLKWVGVWLLLMWRLLLELGLWMLLRPLFYWFLLYHFMNDRSTDLLTIFFSWCLRVLFQIIISNDKVTYRSS